VPAVPIGDLIHRIGRFARDTDGVRTQRIRARAFPLASRMTPFLGVDSDGIRFVVSTRETSGVGYTTFVTGAFDEETLRRAVGTLERHLGVDSLRGMTVLEIGANIGTETVSFLARHGAGRVLAFEPDAENARLLRANVALNGVHDRAEVYEMALSDADATVLLESSQENWGDHRVRVADPQGPDLRDEGARPTVEVVARSIDSLVETGELSLDIVQLVWMDAQGHEGHILAGGRRLVAAGIPVLTEYWPYGLRRAGGLERFHAIIAEGYGTVVDLRTGFDEAPVELDAARVAELEGRYVVDAKGDRFDPHTDLVLLARQPAS
jgi:FkbM family methyltransferase